MFHRFLVPFLGILFLVIPATISKDVSGCGGFVDFKSSQGNSAVKVKLLTSKGVLKDSSDIAPNNGYYFIPLYDHGEYILRVDSPKGFVFEPEEIRINFDGVNDVCSKEMDVNFSFLGFGIFGRVTSQNSQAGPANIELTLRSGGSVIQSQVSKANGDFEFTKVLPGDYQIEAKHESLLFKRNSITVSVKNSNVQLESSDKNLQISGYPLTGKVVNEGQPMPGVSFALLSKSVDSIDCQTKIVSGLLSRAQKEYPGFKLLCLANSAENGSFRFASLSNGNYLLVPFYESQGTKFDVLPKSVPVSVLDKEVVIDVQFEIGGFTVSGAVKNHLKNDESIVAEKVTYRKSGQNAALEAKVNGDGSFTMENVKTGKYIVKVSHSKFFFEETELEISPKNLQLPAMNPTKVQICGGVKLKTGSENLKELKLGVMQFVDGKTSLEYFPFKPPKFCAFITAGKKFSIFVESPPSGPQFLPKSIDLDVKEPRDDLSFEMFSAKVSGKIFLKSDTKLDNVELSLLQGNRVLSKKSFKQSKNSVDFTFDDVSGGEYSIALGKELLQKYCWAKDSLGFTVSNANVDHLKFEQTGFMFQIALSHAADLSIKSPSGKIISVKKDDFGAEQYEKHCLAESGVYEISVESCHVFNDESLNNVFRFDTSRDNQIGQVMKIDARKHLVSGIIQTASNLSDLELKVQSGGTLRKLNFADFKQNFINNQNVYSFSFHEKPNSKLRIEPISGDVLFKPAFQEINVENDCVSFKTNFVGRRGVKVEGKVGNSVEGVDITIFNRANHEVLCITKTDKNGNYVCGPFDDDIRLRIEAAKDGYHFKSVADKIGHFETFKLSSIAGNLVNENGEKMKEVLVSISGGEDNYRKNAVFDGKFLFENLQPGEYFVRFMKKEYEFEPQSEMIQLKNGEDVIKNVRGKKVLFSCLGKVQALNGEPEVGITVEAIGVGNSELSATGNTVQCSEIQEEAISDENGVYKIFGLSPQCVYEVRLKSDSNERVREVIPKKRQVKVAGKDVGDVNFVALQRINSGEVSVYVKTKPEYLKSLTVKLFLASSPEVAVHEQKLTTNPFVFFPSLAIDHASYIVRLESDLSSRLFDLPQAPSQSFKLSDSFSHFRLAYTPTLKPGFTGQDSKSESGDPSDILGNTMNPFPMIALLCAGVAYFYHKQILEFVTKLSQNSGEGGENEGKKLKNKAKKQ